MEFANNHEVPDLILDRLASMRASPHTRRSALDSYRFAAALVEVLHAFVRRGKGAKVPLLYLCREKPPAQRQRRLRKGHGERYRPFGQRYLH